MNEDLIKIKIRKLEKQIEANEKGQTEEFKRLFSFICRHLERIEVRIRELEIKVEMNKGFTNRQRLNTLSKFRDLKDN